MLICKDTENWFQYLNLRDPLNRLTARALRIPCRNRLLVLRLTIAAFLVFSFVRVTPPLTSQTARSPKIVCYLNHMSIAALEAGVRGAEVTRPLVLRFVEALVSVVPKPIPLPVDRQNLLVEIWPEHWGALFRRILPSTVDPAH
jgi:hypothetical protein